MKIQSLPRNISLVLMAILVLISVGCQETTVNPLVGTWGAENTTLIVETQGTFSLSRGGTVITGTYEVLKSGDKIVFSYVHAEALRRMLSGFTVSKDGELLEITRSFFGTLVLRREPESPHPQLNH